MMRLERSFAMRARRARVLAAWSGKLIGRADVDEVAIGKKSLRDQRRQLLNEAAGHYVSRA
jgi:hypothetical protein